MDGDIVGESSCTTCTFAEDFSNYWTQVMYFRAKNGTFKRVPQIANQYMDGANGGMTVYYVAPDDTSVNVTAFKPVRSSPALRLRCLLTKKNYRGSEC